MSGPYREPPKDNLRGLVVVKHGETRERVIPIEKGHYELTDQDLFIPADGFIKVREVYTKSAYRPNEWRIKTYFLDTYEPEAPKPGNWWSRLWSK